MSRLTIDTPSRADLVMEQLYKDLERRIESSPPGLCPVDLSRAFLELCHAQTCGKCVPCRVGLGQLNHLIRKVLNGNATMETLDTMEQTAKSIMESADCAIGYEAAHMVYKGLIGYRDDYIEHIKNGRCTCTYNQPVPCVSLCPAHVDIPGYVALVGEGRYADAIRLIRKDNPFPTTCGFICEHPCEARCRRNMIDDSINIRGLKRVAADFAGEVEPPKCAPSTGKKIAVLGGGPGGLSAAYYLQLMGHQTTVYEMLPKLGGMLRYGIPNYRLPKDRLDEDINAILKTGVEVKQGLKIGVDITIQELREQYDAVLITIGASTDKKLGLPGEDADGVLSAVQFLRSVGKDEIIDLTGKEVVVIGGGNVSMDAVRTAKRLGAKKVSILYRRRRNDMTALAAIDPDPAQYEVVEDRDSFDYIYSGEEMRLLPGRKYSKMKNRISRFQRDYGDRAEFVLLGPEDEPEILQFLDRWSSKKESDDALNRLDSEETGIREAIRFCREAEITIAGVRVNGILEAFSMGTECKETDMTVTHVEKADTELRGLYNYLEKEFLLHSYPETGLVNREDDMGLENLRRTKESMHPVRMEKKYTILEREKN